METIQKKTYKQVDNQNVRNWAAESTFSLLCLRPKRGLINKLFGSETRQYPFAIISAVSCRLVYAGGKFVLAETLRRSIERGFLLAVINGHTYPTAKLWGVKK